MTEAVLKMSTRRGTQVCNAGIKPGRDVNEQSHARGRLRFERPPAQALSAFSDIKFDYVAKMDVPDLGDMVTAKWIVDWSIPDPAQGGLPEYRKIRKMIANKIRSELPQLLAKEPKTKRG